MGTIDGVGEGACVGAEGTFVGKSVGTSVGTLDGAGEGVFVGAEGTTVGDGVGKGVGSGVGCRVGDKFTTFIIVMVADI